MPDTLEYFNLFNCLALHFASKMICNFATFSLVKASKILAHLRRHSK